MRADTLTRPAQGRLRRLAGMEPRSIDAAVLAATLLVAVAYYIGHAPVHRYVGADWFDQSKYLIAARAWAAGNFDPAQHWYLPGYPMLGALGQALTPVQPFWLVDALCLLASLWLCASLAGTLVPTLRHARSLGALSFLLTSVCNPLVLRVWVVPWTTTPAVPLTLAALLLALRFRDAPGPRDAFLAAVAACGLALFRPTEAMVACVTVPPFMAGWLLSQWPGPRRAMAIVLAAGLGAALPLALLATAHLSIYGFAPGAYIAQSAALGFEWRLIPLRWVMIFLGPQPLLATHLPGGFPGGTGMVAMFPWTIPGIAGLAACALVPGLGQRSGHALIAAAIAVQSVAYLAYRDLHPEGLWRFENYHYFKGTLPLLGLYAALLAVRLAGPRRLPSLAAGALVLLPLLCWRAELRPAENGSATIASPHGVTLAHGLTPLDTAIAVAATGGWDPIYFGMNQLASDGRVYAKQNDSVKLYPVPGGFLAIPLRSLPAIPSVLLTDPAIQLDQSIHPSVFQQAVRFGLPCIMASITPGCAVPERLPAPPLELGQTLLFDGQEEPFLLQGWSTTEPAHRWTEGRTTGLFIRPTDIPPGTEALTLTVEARAYLPEPGAMTVSLASNGKSIGTWRFTDAADQVVRARIPVGARDQTGSLTLTLSIDHPVRAPDRRTLGLYVHAIRLDPG